MPKALPLIILFVSPVVLTVALAIVAFGIHAVGRGFGSMRSPAPIVGAAIVVWLLHAGYLIGPWLYHHQRQTLALGLMIPMAILGLLVAAFIAKELVPENRDAMDGKFALYCTAWVIALAAGYIAPIAVMMLPHRHALQ